MQLDSHHFKSVHGSGYTEDNKSFDSLISERPAFVKFFSKMCGHCINMAPEWNGLADADSIKNIGIYVIEVDVDRIDKINSKCKDGAYRGVPYIVMVNKGGTLYKEYTGSRTKDSMTTFILENNPLNHLNKKQHEERGQFKKVKTSKKRKTSKNRKTSKKRKHSKNRKTSKKRKHSKNRKI